jgi:hypothetical protein
MAAMASEAIAEISATAGGGSKSLWRRAWDKLAVMRARLCIQLAHNDCDKLGVWLEGELATADLRHPITVPGAELTPFRKALGEEIFQTAKARGLRIPGGEEGYILEVGYTTTTGERLRGAIATAFRDTTSIGSIGRNRAQVLADVEKRLARLEQAKTLTTADGQREFARALHGFMQACPFYRGTDAIMRASFQAFYFRLFGRKMLLPKGADVHAFILETDEFAEWLVKNWTLP